MAKVRAGKRERAQIKAERSLMALYQTRKRAALGVSIRTCGASWDTATDGHMGRKPRNGESILYSTGQAKPLPGGIKCAGQYPVPIEHYIKKLVREAE